MSYWTSDEEAILVGVLRTKSVVEYLEQKGIYPVKRLSGGKLAYTCPMPDHQESKPSFVVYTQGEFENFYCFGCQAKYHIVDLVARMERISPREALSRLSLGVEITPEDVSAYQVHKINKIEPEHLRSDMELTDGLMMLSSFCRSYLLSVDFDETEVATVDKFWSLVDGHINDFEFDAISEYARELPRQLKHRRALFEQRKREQLKQKYGSKAEALNVKDKVRG